MVKKDVLRTYNLAKGNRLQKIVSCYRSPGVHAIIIFRYGKWLRRRNILIRVFLEPIYYFLFHILRSKWGIEISRSAEIGEGCYIAHYGCIGISGKARIGRNFSISQQALVGLSGQGEYKGVPTIGDDVYIGTGAKIFGKIRIGNNVKIGANAVVYKNIPDNAIVVLNPGYEIISFKGNYPVQK